LESALFDFLASCVEPGKAPLLRLTAADALGRAPLTDPQLRALSHRLASAGALELPKLVAAFERGSKLEVGKKFVAGLAGSPGLQSLTPEALRAALKNYPAEVGRQAEPLLKKLEGGIEEQKARLAELEPVLKKGDAARGRDVFFGRTAACSTCHTVQGQGGRMGPDLSSIGAIRSGKDLLEAIVFPSASFARGFEPYLIKTRDEQVYSGIIARETPEAVYLYGADRTETRIAKDAIGEMRQSRVSIMPQGLDAQLSRTDLADLIAFLQSLR
jgi:putative heme-binding domain-containing protein